MSLDIRTREYSTSVNGDLKKVYSVSVVGPAGPVKTLQTQDVKEVDDFVLKSLDEYPNATINGENTDESPFTSDAPAFKPSKKINEDPPGLASSGTAISNKAPTPNLNNLSSRLPQIRKSSKKKAVDLSGLPAEKQRIYKQSSKQERIDRGLIGPFCGESMEAVPNRITTKGEKVIGKSPTSPAFIICGRDRPRSTASGYGGKGHTQSSCIDLVAGMGGYKPKQVDSNDNPVYTDPDMFMDAARVYISQKTDVDENFAIGKKETYFRSKAKSAVAMKADHVRIIGRESLKLVTYTDRMNSQGGEIRSWSGIELMANNDEDGLQPIPRGDNLALGLRKLSVNVEKLAKILSGFIEYQGVYNEQVAEHTHIAPFFAKPTLPDPNIIKAGLQQSTNAFSKSQMSILKILTNLAGFRHNFLVESGKSYINSRYNKVN